MVDQVSKERQPLSLWDHDDIAFNDGIHVGIPVSRAVGAQEAALWERIKSTRETAPLVDYLQRYPSGHFAELAQLLESIAGLSAVFHLSAVLDDGLLGAQTPERMAGVLQPKRLYERTGRSDDYRTMVQRFKQERVAELQKYPGLDQEIVAAIR